jgi:hypothetical protein
MAQASLGGDSNPRLRKIAAGACNEIYRHTHESIFVILSSQGEIIINEYDDKRYFNLGFYWFEGGGLGVEK